MSEKMTFLPRTQFLTLEEIARLGRCFSELGVTRLRVTGGEPLIRPNVVWLFEKLGALEGVRDLTLTTNGTQLARYAAALKDAGVTRVNISLDTLPPERIQAHHPGWADRQDTGRPQRRPRRRLPADQAEQRDNEKPKSRRGH